MTSVKPPLLFRWLSNRNLVCSMPAGNQAIYLTFDDGPVPEVTPEVLQILRSSDAKATFFCVGENVHKHPEVFRAVVNEGHSIGNHTFNHLNGWRTLPGEYADNVLHCNNYFRTNLFRPPYGRFTPREYFILKKHFRFILWSVLSGDYHHSITKEECLTNVLNNAGDGSIVVFHDSIKAKDNLLWVLPRVLEHFYSRGFSFRAI